MRVPGGHPKPQMCGDKTRYPKAPCDRITTIGASPRRRERSRADDQYFATTGAGAPPIQVIVDADADDVTVEACRRRQRGGIERRITGDGLIAAEPTPCVEFR